MKLNVACERFCTEPTKKENKLKYLSGCHSGSVGWCLGAVYTLNARILVNKMVEQYVTVTKDSPL